jgi:peptide/nickel transport system permease protein
MSAAQADIPLARRRRLPLARARWAVWLCGAIIVVLVVMALFGQWIAPKDPDAVNLVDSLLPGSAEHPFGTDDSGRDIFSRIVAGARLSLLGPLLVVAISTLVGVPLGLLAGYRGGIADAIVSRLCDLLFAFPPLLLAIVIVATFGAGFTTATIAIAITYIPLLARVVRGVVLAERTKPYVEACKVQGFSGMRTALGHVLPNVSPTIVAQSTLNFGYALLDLAGLAFLGLGVQPPTADWGAMLAAGRQSLLISPNELLYASLAITISVIAFNIVGDAIGERFGGRGR